MPTYCMFSEMVPYGLFEYLTQADFPTISARRPATLRKYLNGASPELLPSTIPASKLVVNQKVARALGLSLPTSLLVSVDEVIDER